MNAACANITIFSAKGRVNGGSTGTEANSVSALLNDVCGLSFSLFLLQRVRIARNVERCNS